MESRLPVPFRRISAWRIGAACWLLACKLGGGAGLSRWRSTSLQLATSASCRALATRWRRDAKSDVRRRFRRGRGRRPAHDHMRAQPRTGVVGDEREVPAQFDHAGQLAPVLARSADRTGGCFIDGEHRKSLDLPACQEQAACCSTLFQSGHALIGASAMLERHALTEAQLETLFALLATEADLVRRWKTFCICNDQTNDPGLTITGVAAITNPREQSNIRLQCTPRRG